MGIRVLKAERLRTATEKTTPLVAIVDEKLARRILPRRGDGKRSGWVPNSKAPGWRIVVSSAAVQNRRLDEDAKST